MQDDNKIQIDTEATARLSKVTPNKRKQDFIRKGQFMLLLFICLVIGCMMILPHRSKAEEPMVSPMEHPNNLTLSENLQIIERMKAEQRQKLLLSGQTIDKRQRVTHPPRLRSLVNTQPESLSKEMQLRMNAPTTFDVETKTIASGQGAIDGNIQDNHGEKTLVGNNSNSQFINDQSNITAVSAQQLPHPMLTIPAGEIIPATLETAINSDLPGMVRAITTRDVYSLVGGNLLIPKGSTLVGQFNSNVMDGQRRILVVWNRAQMGDGIIVTLNSPGTDTLGRAGQGADYMDRHFGERFGTSALLSILGASAATAGVGTQDQYNSASQYRMAIANSFQQSAGQTLEKSISIQPTLQVNQGTRINVFVAHDLDFANVHKNG